ncbi:uncharacterized protein E0L32_009357 [Thyridium curvatum]|uniref:ADF-H domain-containing protein n=1 Tax=Thyridium curvatum TaxID=1093900 RepID=A0A507AWU8_9PEZI|nr:uncharacterized protein E0L32_009357 [Thyridium curvatum]TPX09469.1 hypothetical protein E0L32_009357 [Thyridium curvatum]
MSLNGLDDLKIREAHETAAAEPGGWFLLKYASRDEVELLGRGNGGIVEIRNSIAQYEEASPLFGFLRYRRRNVIIKYLPEDCSRLVQARMTVHFNAVCERFSPYDTTFDIQTAKELKDTKLSAACSLHAASGSASSSSSSLRRRRLMEIAEEEEEEQRAVKRQSTVNEEDRPATSDDKSASPQSPASPDPPVTLDSKLADSPDGTKFAVSSEPPSFVGVDRPPSPAKSFDAAHYSHRPDLYSYSSYPYNKPKVKLGPRPSLDVAGRPRTAGNYRPVANLPAGFKMFSKGSRKGRSDNSKEDAKSIKEEEPEITFLATSIPIPQDPAMSSVFQRPHTSGGRPATSSGVSVKSTAPTITGKLGITPEKARLMKAMQLREKKKKMNLQQQQASVTTTEAPQEPTSKDKGKGKEVEAEPQTGSSEEVEYAANEEEKDASDKALDTHFALSKADSGVDVASTLAVDRVSLDTQTDSHPPSPLAMSSELGDSTKASSVSESTDETVQPQPDAKDDDAPEDLSPPVDEEPERLILDDEEDDALAVKRMSEIPERPEDELEEEEASANVSVEQVAGGAEYAQHLEDEKAATEPVAEVDAEPESEPEPEPETAPRLAPALPVSKFATKTPSPRSTGQESQVPETPGAASHKKKTSGLQIPTSKFATGDSQSAQGPTLHSLMASGPPELYVAQDAPPVTPETKRSKRKGGLEPIRTNLDYVSDREAVRSEAHLSDDEDLMDELQSATVQEAKPVLVAKTPVASSFPSQSPPRQTTEALPTPRIVRTVSNPIRGPLLTPGDVSTSSARSVSASGAAYLHQITRQPSTTLSTNKSHMGSGISQRIKALEMLSGSSADGQQRLERPASTFFSVRKTGAREPSRSPSVVERADSLSRHHTPSPPQSRGRTSPGSSRLELRDRSGSMASRLSVFEGGNLPRGRPESIQVTARIVRDPFPKYNDQRPSTADLNQLDLKQSLLVVDHQKGDVSPTTIVPTVIETRDTPRKETIQERRQSKDKRRSQSQDGLSETRDEEDGQRQRRRSSLSIVKDFIKDRRGSILAGRSPSTDNLNNLASPGSVLSASRSPSRPPSVHTTSGLARRLSISSRRSSISKDRDAATPLPTPLSPSLMTEASGSGDEGRSSPGELGHKKTPSGGKSRASRFMRRLSSSLSSSRKNITPTISPTVAEEEEFSNSIPPSSSQGSGAAAHYPTIVAYLGDVNVQFPDNLLWKRRTMCLDSHGFLILSAVQGVTATTTAAAVAGKDKQAGAIKRYHLSDFRQPYTPEMEVQELPNSVCLDFVDGSGLQIACEDRAGQLNVLHVLQDAHQGHTSFGQ